MELFFSKNLLFLRRINKVSQTKIAELVGKVPTAIGSWEKGVNQPSVSDVILLADFFKVDVGLLLAEDLEGKSNGSPEYLRLIIERINNKANNTEVIDTLRSVALMLETLSLQIADAANNIYESAKQLEPTKANLQANDNGELF